MKMSKIYEQITKRPCQKWNPNPHKFIRILTYICRVALYIHSTCNAQTYVVVDQNRLLKATQSLCFIFSFRTHIIYFLVGCSHLSQFNKNIFTHSVSSICITYKITLLLLFCWGFLLFFSFYSLKKRNLSC